MKSFSSVLQNSLRSTAASSELAAKAARANKVKQMWREAVDPVFLDHTNAVYIVREGDEKTLIVYVDDSMFAAELNARRELIKLKFLQKFNEEIEEFKILISRGRYNQNYPFRDQGGDPFYVEPAVRVPSRREEGGVGGAVLAHFRRTSSQIAFESDDFRFGVEIWHRKKKKQ
ncbi:MAG: DciA family protein [Slackia sp.]